MTRLEVQNKRKSVNKTLYITYTWFVGLVSSLIVARTCNLRSGQKKQAIRPSPCSPTFLNLIKLSILSEIELDLLRARGPIRALVLTQPLPPSHSVAKKNLPGRGRKKGPKLTISKNPPTYRQQAQLSLPILYMSFSTVVKKTKSPNPSQSTVSEPTQCRERD
ncbi:hypothetical protein PRUPE_1G174300 [Prunus persica]|uniref:Uncharacterized protein n=1 Tax=Prunus persica TaxID=3760 RepID=A0A251QYV5_PRUPE|nr:hypothetical protein PRUPE_1G174300 [Prunus persica]